MATNKEINDAAKGTTKWLKAKQKKHLKMVNASIQLLQENILDAARGLTMSSAGNLATLQQNWTKLQALHAKTIQLFAKDFDANMKKIIADFEGATTMIQKNFAEVGEIAKFTGIDRSMMTALKDGYYSDYYAAGTASKNKVVRSMYDHVIGGSSFRDLETSIRSTLLGSGAKSATGRPLATYARLYARDQIMNYQNDVSMTKADELEIDHFKYIGTIMGGTRRFCSQRVGRTYSKAEILSWKYKWAGKSGPAIYYRGGYNCRHHWQPVRKEWLEGEAQEQINTLSPIPKK